ncbi:cytochrome P450 [Bradyrhizobium elkanii]|uniref:cytochrome P450 n=1 Tax=Bradyrhizobium elkanii TaxID=29448 RepID=UPI00216A0BE0|nr:cytochrome P450 [Bradyrhizobium elkanii]MCS3520231.1 cytochrome P450 [Bradyrhizobium elkanii]MCS4067886.1 cytochrome P450 [Bradyrhizobium elkanii]MCS4083422.1 cytochrome P450 [Bradyrhizobium elkanii]MCW2126951.1 cytochrome P450 [Bradyrhizobium elkanii]MCW2173698.1 cytochrome P450 [Bradyrhizobium elkanii]
MSTLEIDRAQDEAYSVPIDRIDVSDPQRFQDDTIWPYFTRLRREDPVHYCRDGMFGSYWSITKYRDIMAVDTNHRAFSSEAGGITIVDRKAGERFPMFIAMDPPKHDEQRKTVSPIVAPGNLANLEGLIRSRVRTILDGLPRQETFNWVEGVSIELTTQMLATLFDFPFEDRRLLTYWSDVATTFPQPGQPIDTWERRDAILADCLAYFTKLWNERINKDPGPDLISMLAHSPSTRNMDPREFLGNLILLIVGGNDTTRNSITGGLWFMSQNPGELTKLRNQPTLVPSAVSEIIRYQTPLAHMRRTALQDFTLGSKRIREGDKVIMWYISGNRDEEVIEDPDRFIIDRRNPRQHLSFGFGIHRCVGNRLAELQLRILWEEILARAMDIRVVGEPQRVASNFVHGYSALPTRIAA